MIEYEDGSFSDSCWDPPLDYLFGTPSFEIVEDLLKELNIKVIGE